MQDRLELLSVAASMTAFKFLATLDLVSATISELIFGQLIKLTLNQYSGKWSRSARMRLLGIKIAKMCGRYGFRGSSASEVLQKVKSYNMNKQAVKDLTYGGLMELVNNRNMYYRSSVGKDYSHFTDEGKAAIAEYMEFMAWKMLQAEDADLDRRAKEMVLKELKGK